MQNIRNYDVGIAPLQPTIFNMSKSPLKLLEYASWGIPAVAPNFITYSRTFTHGENTMLYQNGREFYEMMCHMAENHDDVKRLGLNAAKLVHETRTEKVNAQERYDFYKSIIDGSPKPMRFIPETANAT
jgi:glycosyltransferase involved in cell wall biosynthesis